MEIDYSRYNTDKGLHFLKNYERWFAELRDKEVHILELGILDGGSLELWRDFFPKGKVVGIDLKKFEVGNEERIFTFAGSQDDPELYRRIQRELNIPRFDIIIDDASHVGNISLNSFNILYNGYLRNGGLYVVEDWGTGYWSHWPDGHKYNAPSVEGNRIRSNDHGMVGFIKALVDYVAFPDIVRFDSEAAGSLVKVRALEIQPGQVCLTKPSA
ncbi:MAG: hypothetical protein KDJ80_07010 [Nitratireductor sp.]|nr:hypothetical protein [Nitratireductor sp.]